MFEAPRAKCMTNMLIKECMYKERVIEQNEMGELGKRFIEMKGGYDRWIDR